MSDLEKVARETAKEIYEGCTQERAIEAVLAALRKALSSRNGAQPKGKQK